MTEITRLLWLAGDGVTVIERRDGALLEPRMFPLGEERALAAFAAAAPRGRWRMVVERGEEECRVERLPRLRGLDRRRLLAATAKRLFPATPYCRWERLEADGEGERWCFSALADPGPLRAPLEALGGQPLEGITSPVQLLPELLARLGERAGDRLVAWRALGSGLRLVLLRGGRPAATRLAPEGAELDEELAATRAYLERNGLWPEAAGEPFVLDGAGGVDCLGVHRFDPCPFADPLFAALALGLRRLPAYRDGGRSVTPASNAPLLLLTGALAAGGWQAQAALENRQEAQRLEWAALRSAAPHTVVADVPSPRRLLAAVERADALAPFTLGTGAPLRRVGRVLEAFPEVRLEGLRWTVEGVSEGRIVLELAGRVDAGGGGVAALAGRLRGEAGVERVAVSRSPLSEGFGGVEEGAFELRVEARVGDGWR